MRHQTEAIAQRLLEFGFGPKGTDKSMIIDDPRLLVLEFLLEFATAVQPLFGTVLSPHSRAEIK